jgi:hypothetical protein
LTFDGIAGSVGITLEEAGNIQVRRHSIISNVIVTAAVGLLVKEATAQGVNGILAIGNSFDAATKATLPRTSDHFLNAYGNEGLPDITRAPYIQLAETAVAPANPAGNDVRLYVENNGAGKFRLMAKFVGGAAVQVAIQP